MAGGERGVHRGRTLRLDADDADPGASLLDRRHDPRDQPSAADRHHDRGHAWQLVEDLQADRALARDDPLVIEWRDDREPPRHRLGFGPRPPVRRGRALEDHFRAVGPRPVDFHARRRGRHHHHRRRPERARGERHGLPVIARRKGDDAALPLVGGQLRDHVVGPANLERAARLHVLALEQQRPPGVRGDVDERRDAGDARDALASGVNIGESDHVCDCSCRCPSVRGFAARGSRVRLRCNQKV